ncbi:hypothetical protein K457DRAFT_25189 [Linnemannia elongata AG-77]|uniref:Pirin C-terminal domain-containing protein n=1 Tax=Linnemannia elongata AG-77 TaxID=1314771 RepID=A0A197JE89_9FUNG|nr:hypothetical protein K457DRAFT_25189 [Linnemannia elongata AG-77]
MPVKFQTSANGLQLWIDLYKEHKFYVPQHKKLMDTEAKVHHTLHLSADGTGTVRIQKKGEKVNLVVNAGDPLELVVQIGPFVTNTREDVYETYQYHSDAMDGFE